MLDAYPLGHAHRLSHRFRIYEYLPSAPLYSNTVPNVDTLLLRLILVLPDPAIIVSSVQRPGVVNDITALGCY